MAGKGKPKKGNEQKRKLGKMAANDKLKNVKESNTDEKSPEADGKSSIDQVESVPQAPTTSPKKKNSNSELLNEFAHSVKATAKDKAKAKAKPKNAPLRPLKIQQSPKQDSRTHPPVDDLNVGQMIPQQPNTEAEIVQGFVYDMIYGYTLTLESGNRETKGAAAQGLLDMALKNKSHMVIIGDSNALQRLINLLEEGDTSVRKDACRAINAICQSAEYRKKAIHCGAVGALIANFKPEDAVEFTFTLRLLANEEEGVEEMIKNGAVGLMLDIIKMEKGDEIWEWCIEMLDIICGDNQNKEDGTEREEITLIKTDEQKHGTISKVLNEGTNFEKEKAKSLLWKLVLPILEDSE